MNVVAEIQRINERELELNIPLEASWHAKYKESAWVYVGGLPYELSEGDVICVLSQFGEIEDLNLVRDEKTGKSKGFAFAKYEDQRSTILAVDNLNGASVLDRTLRVDHVLKYKLPKEVRERDEAREAEDSDSENASAMGPRGLPGHAYEGKELATNYDIQHGQNVFEAPAEDKKERKKRKKAEKKERKKAKKLRKIEEKQSKHVQEVQRRRAQLAEKEESKKIQEKATPTASSSGWRGRMEPSAPSARPQYSREEREEKRDKEERKSFGGLGRTR